MRAPRPLFFAAAAVLAAACTGADGTAPTATTARGSKPEVTVDGPVQRVVARNVFEVGSDAPSSVTVVWRDERGEIRAGVLVRATGTVRAFDRRTIERRLAIDLEDERVADLAGEDVLVARQVEVRSSEGGADR